jgi:MFS transporter, FSR family, fosmidomycin resistance protein
MSNFSSGGSHGVATTQNKTSADGRGWKVLAFTSLAHFANDGTSFFVPLLVDLIALAYGIDVFLVATANFLLWISITLGAIAFGPVIDRRNLHVEGMAFGILALSLGLILFSLALEGVQVTFFLLLSSVIAGFGASFYHPTGASILQSYYKGSPIGRYLGINGSAGSLGRALYPSLLLLLGAAFASNALSAQFCGILGIVFSAAIFLGLRSYGGVQNGRTDSTAPEVQAANKESSSGLRTSVTPAIVLLTVISFMRSVAFSGIVSFIPEYISFERGAGAGLSLGALTTLMYSGGIAGQLFFGRLVENHDRRVILALSTLSSALLLLAYLLTTGVVSLIALALFGFANFSGFPIFMSMTSDYIKKETTTGNAIVWNLGNTGGRAAGPLVVGALIAGSYSNLPFAFEVSLVAALGAALMAIMLPKPGVVQRAFTFS